MISNTAQATDKPKLKDGEKMAKKRRNHTLVIILYTTILLIGALIFAYPYISMSYYRVDTQKRITIFEKEKQKISTANLENRLDLAKNVNEAIANHNENTSLQDPYTTNKQEQEAAYAKMLEVNDFIAYVSIPKINEYLPLYAGTSDATLYKGLGHLEGTSLPIGGKSTHTVIAGHSGHSKAKIFRDLEKLEIGDIFYIHNIFDVLAYQVDQIKTVEPTEYEDLLITEDKDQATLLTCTPYAVNTHRLLVRGKRLHFEKKTQQTEIQHKQIILAKQDRVSELVFFIGLILSLLFLILALNLYIQRYKLQKRMKQQASTYPPIGGNAKQGIDGSSHHRTDGPSNHRTDGNKDE